MLARSRYATFTVYRPARAWLVVPLLAVAGMRAERQWWRKLPRFGVRPPSGVRTFGAVRARLLLSAARIIGAGVAVRS